MTLKMVQGCESFASLLILDNCDAIVIPIYRIGDSMLVWDIKMISSERWESHGEKGKRQYVGIANTQPIPSHIGCDYGPVAGEESKEDSETQWR